ncbi:MAG: alpha/beta hydrolase, partial [Planctomycetes bacterium]|nr:alpha/beta hydrolase [Planctomycetota bacterium]
NKEERKARYYEDRYRIESPEQICTDDIMICPVNITYYPIRPDKTFINSLVNYFVKDMPERLEEEIRVEGQIFFSETDISVYFDEPIAMGTYLDNIMPVTRLMLPFVSTKKRNDLIFFLEKKKLTRKFMKSIYTNVAVNIDHLFCACIRHCTHKQLDEENLKRMIYLCADKLHRIKERRSHPTLRAGLLELISHKKHKPYEEIFKLALKECAIAKKDNKLYLTAKGIREKKALHSYRLRRLVNVFSNEVEPLTLLMKEIKTITHLTDKNLKSQLVQTLIQQDLEEYERDYLKYFTPNISHSKDIGQPFFLDGKDNNIGIVLCHGYMAAPKEVEDFAIYLHQLGYSVYCPRMVGHGTAPQNLKDVSHEDWIKSYERGIAIISNHCKHTYAAGFSAGGLLALYTASFRNQNLQGIISINTPLKLRDLKNKLVPAAAVWNAFLEKIHIDKGKIDFVSNQSENPHINYNQNYIHGIHELQKMIDACLAQLSEITLPTLILQSKKDPVVHPDSAKTIHDKLSSKKKEIEYTSHENHIIIKGKDSFPVFQRVVQFMERHSVND